MIWKFRKREIDLTMRGLLVGIINATPDSFSDGGKYLDPDAACEHGLRLLREGAEVLDIGGESTKPGSFPVSAEEELLRVVPVIKALRAKTDALFSIDTSKSSVASAALEAGADIINDVTAMRGDPLMGELAARSGAGVILMHMQGDPQTMQEAPSYPDDDVVGAVAKDLSERRDAVIGFGVDATAIILDPGIGFGKTVAHNMSLLRGIPVLASLGSPLMIGHSRKSFLGDLADGRSFRDSRLPAALAVTCMARQMGARLFRVHEALPHAEALRMTESLLES